MGFKGYHPIVNFVYFVLVIGFSCVLMHPVCLLISFFGGFVYSVLLKGSKAIRTNILYMTPVILMTAIMNPVFNHRGVTILSYLPGGNPLTMESIVYGMAAGVMLINVICWFSCFNAIMTGDKIIYLFGRIIPSLSLVFSMVLRFVPRFASQMKNVAAAQKCIGRDMNGGGIIKRAKYGLSILSVMITWSLENSIDTADSMKSRGYGLPGRTVFSLYRLEKRDFVVLGIMLTFGIYVFFVYLTGMMEFLYFPFIKNMLLSFWGFGAIVCYFILCSLPAIIDIREVKKWNALKSRG